MYLFCVSVLWAGSCCDLVSSSFFSQMCEGMPRPRARGLPVRSPPVAAALWLRGQSRLEQSLLAVPLVRRRTSRSLLAPCQGLLEGGLH